MEQQIRFCTTTDGTRIAYAVTGSGPPLLWVPGWLSHLELDLEFPPFRERCQSLAKDFTLIRFDKRGTGLSQRGIKEFSTQAHILDIEAVVAATQLKKYILVGYSEGGTISIAYTAKHFDSISHLILMGTYPDGTWMFAGPDMQRAAISIIRNEWGLGSRLLADLFFGEDAGPAVLQMFAHYQQQAATAADALASATATMQYDVNALLPTISTPTLVIHARGDRTAPIEGGQYLATRIAGARFVSVHGNHIPDRKQMAQMDDAIREFILGVASRRGAPIQTAPSALVTIMFTDIEGSTTLTQRLGDAKAQDILRAHNTVIRDALATHNGSEIKHTGDGIMASFGSASRALACAIAIQQAFAADADVGAQQPRDSVGSPEIPSVAAPLRPETPVRVRIGLNAGEPVAEDHPDGHGDLFGTAVQLAARVCAQAQPGQILAANVVRELAAGKGFLFSDQGDTALRGFEDPVRLYAVRWQEPA